MNLQNEPVVGDPLDLHNRRDTVSRHTKGNSAFSQKVPGLQLSWDSTSAGLLKTCPYKYYLSQVLGMNGKGPNVHLIFGLVLHASLEAYDRARASGKTWREGARAALRVALTNSGARVPAVSGCSHCSLTPDGDERWARQWDNGTWDWRCKQCGEVTLGEGPVAPTRWVAWQSQDKFKNLHNLVKAVVWYLGKFADDPTKTVILDDGQPAVELSFKIATGLPALSDEHYVLVGYLDRLVEFAGATYVQDRKTTKSILGPDFFDKFSPNNQMTFYAFAGKQGFGRPIAGVMVDAIQTMTHAVRFRRKLLGRTEGQLEDWWDDFQILLEQNEGYVRDLHWPQNDMSCGNYGGCPYLQVCAQDKEAHWRVLQSEYEFRPWDPTVSRGPE